MADIKNLTREREECLKRLRKHYNTLEALQTKHDALKVAINSRHPVDDVSRRAVSRRVPVWQSLPRDPSNGDDGLQRTKTTRPPCAFHAEEPRSGRRKNEEQEDPMASPVTSRHSATGQKSYKQPMYLVDMEDNSDDLLLLLEEIHERCRNTFVNVKDITTTGVSKLCKSSKPVIGLPRPLIPAKVDVGSAQPVGELQQGAATDLLRRVKSKKVNVEHCAEFDPLVDVHSEGKGHKYVVTLLVTPQMDTPPSSKG